MTRFLKLLGVAFSAASVIGIIAVLHEFMVKYAEQRGWYDNLPVRIESIASSVVSVTDNIWFKLILVYVLSVATSIGIIRLSRRSEIDNKIATINTSGATDSRSEPAPKSPNIRLNIVNMSIFVAEGSHPDKGLSGIAVEADVWNLGQQSTVVEWGVVASHMGEPPAVGQVTMLPERLVLGGYAGKVISSTESLVTKTEESPVTRSRVKGILLFYFRKTWNEMRRADTVLELHARDELDNLSYCRRRIGDLLSTADFMNSAEG